jgi:hypothetical protein
MLWEHAANYVPVSASSTYISSSIPCPEMKIGQRRKFSLARSVKSNKMTPPIRHWMSELALKQLAAKEIPIADLNHGEAVVPRCRACGAMIRHIWGSKKSIAILIPP